MVRPDESKKLGSMVPKKGLTLYACNPETKEIYVVEKAMDVRGRKYMVLDPEHYHTWALNLKNAQRKFTKNYQLTFNN